MVSANGNSADAAAEIVHDGSAVHAGDDFHVRLAVLKTTPVQNQRAAGHVTTDFDVRGKPRGFKGGRSRRYGQSCDRRQADFLERQKLSAGPSGILQQAG